MAISAVGTVSASSGAGIFLLNVDPTTLGDLIVLAVLQTESPQFNLPTPLTGVLGGGCSQWLRLVFSPCIIFASGFSPETELWYGTVTTTGPSLIVLSGYGSGWNAMGAQQFTAGAPQIWTPDGFNISGGAIPGPTGNFPGVTPSGSGELYVGNAAFNASSSGSSGGFTYDTYGQLGLFVYNTSASSPTLQDPNWAAFGASDCSLCDGLIIGLPPIAPEPYVVNQAPQRASSR